MYVYMTLGCFLLDAEKSSYLCQGKVEIENFFKGANCFIGILYMSFWGGRGGACPLSPSSGFANDLLSQFPANQLLCQVDYLVAQSRDQSNESNNHHPKRSDKRLKETSTCRLSRQNSLVMYDNIDNNFFLKSTLYKLQCRYALNITSMQFCAYAYIQLKIITIIRFKLYFSYSFQKMFMSISLHFF